MAESTLTLGYPELQVEVADYLGFNTDTATWDATTTARVDRIIQSGVRQFYFPPNVPGVPRHEWSFLKAARGTLTLTDGDYDYDLPDDYGGQEAGFTYASTDYVYHTVVIVPEGKLLALRQDTTAEDDPQYAAIRPKASTGGTTGHRFEAIFWPTPGTTRTLTYPYKVLANEISTGSPYPLGGMSHSETVKASCRAVAEREKNDERGVERTYFTERLLASIQQDQREHGPKYFGYNGDRSDRRGWRYNDEQVVTVNGVTPVAP